MLSRVKVGHTHDDGDSVFAVMGDSIADDEEVETWEDWKEVIRQAFNQPHLEIDVIDLFIIPDISKVFSGAFKHFGNFAKGMYRFYLFTLSYLILPLKSNDRCHYTACMEI